MRTYIKMTVALLSVALLSACGHSGPSKADIQKLMNQEMTQLENVGAGMGMNITVTVDSASCTPTQNGIYSCLVTATTSGGLTPTTTQASTINVTESNGNWVLVN
jgi:hypothetical protein